MSTRSAVRYAKAILDIATDKSVTEAVNKDMSLIAATMSSHTELYTFVQSPTITIDVKEKALLEVFSEANQVTKSLFRLLFENKRFEILSEVATEYNRLFDVKNGMEVATVTTAIPMDAALESKVMEKVTVFSNKKITIKNVVDPSIIGGFVLRIGDKQYNASIANRLQVLKRELSN